MYTNIANEKDFKRDVSSKAMINTNVSSLHAYKAQKQQTKRIGDIQNDVEELKKDIGEIKQLLRELVTNDSNS